jgi:hypothetical protein
VIEVLVGEGLGCPLRLLVAEGGERRVVHRTSIGLPLGLGMADEDDLQDGSPGRSVAMGAPAGRAHLRVWSRAADEVRQQLRLIFAHTPVLC